MRLFEKMVHLPDQPHTILFHCQHVRTLAQDHEAPVRGAPELGEDFLRHVEGCILIPLSQNE